jgi:Ca2+-binding EF-hand superfamily protein
VPGNSSGSDAKSLFDALSSSDTNGDGVLSADEIATSAASGVMSDDFGSIDSDGDGELNETEVGSFESAVNEVLGAMGSAATIGQMVDAASQSSMDQVQGHHHHHGPPSDASFGMDEATATVVADALTSVLNAADANKDSTLSGGELTSYLANASSSDARSNSLAESIVKAMANQSAKASNQEVLAQQYTNILQTLSA